MTIEGINTEVIYNESEWICDTPDKADWAIEKIKETRARRDLFIAAAKKKIEQLEEQIQNQKNACDNQTGYLMEQLNRYLDKVPAKKTKTQMSLELPSGKIVRKLPHPDFVRNDTKLLEYLKEFYPEMIVWSAKVNWSDFKKYLQIVDNTVIRVDTGEVIDPSCISVQMVSESVDVR